MTRDEIISMEAGREMDAWISDKVFSVRTFSIFLESGDIEYLDWNTQLGIPRYSADIAAAWHVMEELKSKKTAILSELIMMSNSGKRDDLKWFCRMRKMSSEHDTFCVSHETAPLAICRAALLAVMGGV